MKALYPLLDIAILHLVEGSVGFVSTTHRLVFLILKKVASAPYPLTNNVIRLIGVGSYGRVSSLGCFYAVVCSMYPLLDCYPALL